MAAAALAKAGDTDALTWLREQLASDDRPVRNTVAFALARLGGETDVKPLSSALGRETDESARAILVSALACLGSARGRTALGHNLESADPAVRTVSAEFAGHGRCYEYQAQLIRLLDDATLDTRVRGAVADCVVTSRNETVNSR